MDQAHPNAASIKGMLDDAAGNFCRGTPSQQQQTASQQDTAAGGAAAGASDAGARAEVRERCALLPRQHCNRLVTPRCWQVVYRSSPQQLTARHTTVAAVPNALNTLHHPNRV